MNSRKRITNCLLFGMLLHLPPALAQSGAGLSQLTRLQAGRSKAVTSSAEDFNSNYDRRTYIEPGETMVLADISGPGVITHIWLFEFKSNLISVRHYCKSIICFLQ